MMGTLSGSALGDQGRRQARAASSVARASDTRGAPSSVFPGGEGRGGARGGGAGGSPYYASFLFFSLRKRVVFISPTTILRLSYTKGLHIQNTHEVPAFILLSRARRIFLRSFVSSLCRSSLLFSLSLSLSLSLHSCTLPRNSSPMQPIMGLLALGKFREYHVTCRMIHVTSRTA